MSTETPRAIDLGLSVADAGAPNMAFASGVLIVTFKNWQAKKVEVGFPDVVGFLWQDEPVLLPNEPDDDCVEVLNSQWAAQHLAKDPAAKKEELRHINLNFNAAGQLSVLFQGDPLVNAQFTLSG